MPLRNLLVGVADVKNLLFAPLRADYLQASRQTVHRRGRAVSRAGKAARHGNGRQTG